MVVRWLVVFFCIVCWCLMLNCWKFFEVYWFQEGVKCFVDVLMGCFLLWYQQWVFSGCLFFGQFLILFGKFGCGWCEKYFVMFIVFWLLRLFWLSGKCFWKLIGMLCLMKVVVVKVCVMLVLILNDLLFYSGGKSILLVLFFSFLLFLL